MWKKIERIMVKGYGDLRLRAAVTGVLALVWWGILYPELCFTENTFQQIFVTDGEEKIADGADYKDILGAEKDEIVIRSRLLEWLEEQKWFRL